MVVVSTTAQSFGNVSAWHLRLTQLFIGYYRRLQLHVSALSLGHLQVVSRDLE